MGVIFSPMMSGEVTSNWITLSDSFYDKVELYSGVFSNVPVGSLVVSGQYGGPVLSLDRQTVTVLTSSGEQLSVWKWNNPPAVAAGWSDTEEPLFVLEDGTVLIYSMFGVFKSSFTMGQEAKNVKILSARIFSSVGGTGVAILTTIHRFYVVNSVVEPRVRQLYDCGELTCPTTGWIPVTTDRQTKLLVGRGKELVILSYNEMTVLELELGDAKVKMVSLSPSQNKMSVVMESGLLWLGTMSSCLVSLQLDQTPSQMAWCGEEAVFLTLDSGTAMLVHTSGESESMFQPVPLSLVQECDGVRVICQGFHDLIHRVEDPVRDIYRIASMSPGAILLMASQAFTAKSHKADEYIRMISGKVDRAVSQCVAAAGALFQSPHQKELMKAAKFGNAFLSGKGSGTSTLFYQQCTTLKLLNSVRHYKLGIPLTLPQLNALSRPVLIDRLIQRRLFPLALQVCEFLQLPPAEGRSRVLAHWAIYKVETSSTEETETARQVSQRLGLTPDISYTDIAEKAAECGKKQLAIQLLEHEVRADRQVPLLLKLGQGAQALRKAIYSGDTDLIYHVILSLQEQHSTADFHLIMRQDEVGAKLYTLYCEQYAPSTQLADWLQQEDDFSGMARQTYRESYSTGRVETRLARLVTAQEQFKRAKEEFNLNMTEENHKLIKYQAGLEDKLGKMYVNLSLHNTISQLIKDNEVKLADKLRTEFKVSDRKYFWLKLRAFAESGQWSELGALARSKKTCPLGSFGPFLDVCLEQGEKGQAVKFLPLLQTQEERLKYTVKLEMLAEAAEAAFNLHNMEALSVIEVKAVNNFSLLETIASYKQKLQTGR